MSSNEYFDLSIDIIDAQLLNQYKAESKNNLAHRGIQFYGRETISYLINAGQLKVSKWCHNVTNENCANKKCELLEFQELNDGDFIFNRSNETIMYESAQTNVALVSLELKRESAPLTLMFSAFDQELKFQNPSNDIDSRIQLSMLLLKNLDSTEAIPTLKKYLTNSKYYIRWYAMQQILGIDALQVLGELRQMAKSDAHPEVRIAAYQTLKIISRPLKTHTPL